MSSSEAHPRQFETTATVVATVAAEQTRQQVQLDLERKAELRRAGQDFLDRAMHTASKADGTDPFQTAIQPSPSSRLQSSTSISKRRRPGRPGASEDPDVVAFGLLYESSKLYVYMAMYVVCHAVGLVLMKGSLHSMKTPAVLTFLHMLCAVGALALASQYDVIVVHPLSALRSKGCSVKAALMGLQLLFTFSALLHGSVNLVLCCITLMPGVLDAACSFFLHRLQPSKDVAMSLQIAAAACALEWLCDGHKSVLGVVMLLLLSAVKAAELLWRYLKQDATAGGAITDFAVVSLVREVAEEEEALSPADAVFLSHLLPAVPILLLGFGCLEGKEIVDHELSVPAVSVMLLSCAAYIAVVACQLLLDEKLPQSSKLYLRGAALLGTVVFNYMVPVNVVTTMIVL
ncbi:MAG: hypothetical protein WDW36_000820 [Sanguina aurantia]